MRASNMCCLPSSSIVGRRISNPAFLRPRRSVRWLWRWHPTRDQCLPPDQVRYSWVPRARNKDADRLANEAMDAAAQGRRWERRGGPASGGDELDLGLEGSDDRSGDADLAAFEEAAAQAVAAEAVPARGALPEPEEGEGRQHGERLRYRVLTGPDDREFCERVSRALAEGYQLHGGPAVTFDGTRVVVTQAVVLP